MSDLVQRLREYARGPGRAASVVSSAWLAREFSVDPRTIAAALRPYGVAPGEVERGIRGYSTAELAGIVLPGDEQVNHWSAGMTAAEVAETVAAGNVEVPLAELSPDEEDPDPVDVGPVDTVGVLSAAAGHDMTPALRAAGLL